MSSSPPGDARVYLPDAVADTLDENILDATIAEDGGVRLTIDARA